MKSRLLIVAMSLASLVAISLVIAGQMPRARAGSSPATMPSPTPSPKQKARNAGYTFEFIDDWDGTKLELPESQWRKILSPGRYQILRKAGTERSYTGRLLHNKANGTYYCAACGLALFRSAAKYDSKTGWPSFYEPLDKSRIIETEDRSLPEEVRTEVRCARCGSHLGHVFDDGPPPTGLRYCINSAALRFRRSPR